MSDELLFPSDLLEGNIQDSVPAGYILRPLARDDHRKGFFECLQSLTWTGDVSEQRYQKHLDWLRNSSPGWFYCLVIEHEGEIVATGVVIAGRKLYVRMTIAIVEGVLTDCSTQYMGSRDGRPYRRCICSEGVSR